MRWVIHSLDKAYDRALGSICDLVALRRADAYSPGPQLRVSEMIGKPDGLIREEKVLSEFISRQAVQRGPLAAIRARSASYTPKALGLALSDPRMVANGSLVVRTSPPSTAFWDAYRSDREGIKEAGYSVKKIPNGDWQVVHFSKPSADELSRRSVLSDASRASSSNAVIPSPPGLTRYPYQVAGIARALDMPGVLIGDEMGLGKTGQAIGVADVSGAKSVLVICPASLRINWEREFKMWATRPMSVAAVMKSKMAWPTADVVIINYDLLPHYDSAIKAIEWDCLIIDEAHYLKGGAKTRRGAHVFGSRAKGLLPIKAKRKIVMTGTPISNRPVEIWPLVHYLSPKEWDSFPAFAKRYCNAKETSFGFDAKGASNLDELQRRLRETVMIRRLKKDVLAELPPKTRQLMVLPSNGAEKEIAAELDVWKNMKGRVGELQIKYELAKASPVDAEYKEAIGSLRASVTAAFTEMARARKAVAIAKIPALVEHVREALLGGKVILFVHHRDVYEAIRDEFKDHSVGIIGGDTPRTRQAAVDSFQKDETKDLFVGTFGAAGVGITLTAASHVIAGELDWVPGNMTQAEDRCILQGQPVLTPGGWVPIESLKVGDDVISHTGAVRRITDTHTRKAKSSHRHNSKNIVTISTLGFHIPMKVTHDHRILTDRGWLEAQSIRPGDHILMPAAIDGTRTTIDVRDCHRLPEFFVGPGGPQKNGRLKKIPPTISLTPDAMFTFGYYIGDGFCRVESKRGKHKCGRFVSMSGNTGKKGAHLRRIESWFSGINVNKATDSEGPGVEWRFFCGEWALWFSDNLGRTLDEKAIPAWVFECTSAARSEFLCGLMASDGYVRDGRHEYVTVSWKLASQVARLITSLGKKACVTVGSTGQFIVAYTNGVAATMCVTEVHQRAPSKTERVHDITVETDHTFVVGLGVVHNCHRIGQAQNVLCQWVVLDGSLDNHMARTLMSKAAIIDKALDAQADNAAPTEPDVVDIDGIEVFSDQQDAVRTAKREKIAREAEKLNPAYIVLIHEALRTLAALDGDRASITNGVGFSRIDGGVGHELARASEITARQAALGLRIVMKYGKQLPEEPMQLLRYVRSTVLAA